LKLLNEEFTFGFFKKRNLLVFFAVMSIYIGLSLGNTPAFLFGMYCLILLMITAFLSYFSAKGIRCKRNHLPRTFEGTEVDVHISLENDSFYPLYMVEIRDVFVPGESYYVNILAQYKIDTNHFIDLKYRGKCIHHRGLYTLGPIITHSSDPLGIIPIRRELPVISDLMVYPNTKEIKGMILYELGTLFNIGQEATINSGMSAEFSGVREYRYGDNFRHIHWGLSAKHNKWIIKEFEETVVTEVSIFVDLYRYSHTGIGDVSTLEYAVKVAVSVAELAIENSHQVRVFAMGMQGARLSYNVGTEQCSVPTTSFDKGDYKEGSDVPLGAGHLHLITILDKLTFYKIGTIGSFEDEFIEKVNYIRRGSTVVLITCSSNFKLDKIMETLKELIANRVRIIFIIIDDRTFIKVWKRQKELQREAMPIYELEKILKENGCIVYILKKDDEIGIELSKGKETVSRGKK